MALWLAATIAHFVLTFVWVRAFGPRRMDQDDVVFHSAVIGLGSLQTILHALAFSVGLSLGRGLGALTADGGRVGTWCPESEARWHSAGAASRLAALPGAQLLPIFSRLAPCQPGPSPASV
jgi:hypothetical protein